MAGLGRKVFNAGEVLSAANVQGYLQDQVVQVYSGTAARSSALGTAVSEGMMSYLTDANELSIYTSNGTAAWSPVNLAQSPNAIINGAFDIWQRGTTITPAGGAPYTADRWAYYFDGSGATRSVSQQTFTPGNTISGYESAYYLRYNQSVAGSGGTYSTLEQAIEDVRTFAGQTITISFWAKADSARTITSKVDQYFGSGGSTRTFTTAGTHNLTTSWQRFTAALTVPSISGKTIGANSFLGLAFDFPLNSIMTIDIWGVQLEAGSTATPFKRNAPSIQAELAACQRYYWRNTPGGVYSAHGNGNAISTTQAQITVQPPVTMRVSPTSVEYGNLMVSDNWNAGSALTGLAVNYAGTNAINMIATVASGLTQYRPYTLANANNAAGYFALSAEL